MKRQKREKCIGFDCDCSRCEQRRYQKHIDTYGEEITFGDGTVTWYPGQIQLLKAWSKLTRSNPVMAMAIIQETYKPYKKQTFKRKDRKP